MTKPHLRLVDGIPVPVQVKRLPQPMDKTPWPVGQGARYWTPDRIAELAAQNEQRRRGK